MINGEPEIVMIGLITMSKNVGKRFEEDVKSSIPDYCLLIRLPDPPHSFTKRSDTRFSIKNPCDYILFDSSSKTLFPIELKTTKYKSISFEGIDGDDNESRMVHKHQILGLLEMSKYDGVNAGFIFNFRDEKNNMERTYFQDIKSFVDMIKNIDKHSFNELDLLTNNAKRINGEKKRVRYRWDFDSFFKDMNGCKLVCE